MHILLDEVHAGAGGGGERQVNLGRALRKGGAVDQPKVNQRHRKLGIQHLPQDAPECGVLVRGRTSQGVRPCIPAAECVRAGPRQRSSVRARLRSLLGREQRLEGAAGQLSHDETMGLERRMDST